MYNGLITPRILFCLKLEISKLYKHPLKVLSRSGFNGYGTIGLVFSGPRRIRNNNMAFTNSFINLAVYSMSDWVSASLHVIEHVKSSQILLAILRQRKSEHWEIFFKFMPCE
ncbi:hypothetical protein AVEN_269037-1 [Araneus ventricosus]|uniref:Uncharacterized protein n=1 Tax=Araneus ventricosus TaxID=182803 RepID=A0A4Y2LBU3_ARAVE|nr:hypothetical protein AVEN_269037-1 [Araneus ventricosus]